MTSLWRYVAATGSTFLSKELQRVPGVERTETFMILKVFDVLVEAGAELGLRHAGFQALNTLRLDKAYRDIGWDMDNTNTPQEAGLGFAVASDKPGGFIGREARLRQKEEGMLKHRLVHVLLEDPEPLRN